MDSSRVNYFVEDGIAVIEMNYPEKLNPIDQAMANALYEAFHEAERDPIVKVIIWRGAGKHFSGGGDVKLFAGMVDEAEPDFEPLERQMLKVGQLMDFIKKMGKLVVCEVTGAAAGGGATLALAADFCICADNAKFVQAFVNIALVPDICGTYLLSKAVGVNRAMDLITSGRTVYAEEALEIGLVCQIAPAEELRGVVMDFARKLAKGPTLAYGHMKRQIYEVNYRGMVPYLENVEYPLQKECFRSKDFSEGVHAFIDKRAANFQGK